MAAAASERISGERSLRPLGGVLAAMAVSLTGTRISAIALPWFVLATTGSATRTGLVAFCEMVPYVVAKAFTGPLVDRAGPRSVSWVTDVVSASAVGAVPLLHALDMLSFWPLLVLVAVIGAARGPGDLAKEVMVPEAAERALIPLERAAGLTGVTERLAATVGPAIGGATVALVGPLAALTADAVCFASGSVIIALALPRRSAHVSPAAEGPPEPGYWSRFGDGFRFLRQEPLLLTITVTVGILNLLDAAFSTLLMPVWARESGHGPSVIGLTGSVLGIAAVGGSLIAAAVAHRMRRRLVFFGGFLVAGAPRFLVLAAGAPMWAVLAVFAASGFGMGFLNPILGAITFERVPRPLLGRVNALGDSLAWAGIPLGGLIAGAGVASFGLTAVLLVAAAAYVLTTTVTALRPQWREMDRVRASGSTPAPGLAPAPAPATEQGPDPLTRTEP
ncbi:MFS transporter [Streptomyces sp. NPDC048696]|uniref:MFS transporter n=1 Tax=Streptomyces sp. NPDC048696 TaxID=3365585 RepID=UPI00371C28BB